MTNGPLVSIVIPHLKGAQILTDCLDSLNRTAYADKEVLLVDNGSSDGSVDIARKRFPWVKVIRQNENLGYAGGCNSGFEQSQGKYVLFLNDDITIEDPSWLGYLVATAEADSAIAGCQPKLLSAREPHKFDYAGGAGGLIDRFGFPFARGRLFFTLEEDKHQYEDIRDIFWTSGTAMFCRKSALDEVGIFDPHFFAHQEEIDLCWRLQLSGYRLVAEPRAVVYHHEGSTLATNSYLKVYLNHRNNLVMLLKNYQWPTLLWVLPARLVFECGAIVYSIVKLDFVRIGAVLHAFFYLIFHARQILMKRRTVQRIRTVDDKQIFTRMYRGSIIIDYFLRGVRSVHNLEA